MTVTQQIRDEIAADLQRQAAEAESRQEPMKAALLRDVAKSCHPQHAAAAEVAVWDRAIAVVLVERLVARSFDPLVVVGVLLVVEALQLARDEADVRRQLAEASP